MSSISATTGGWGASGWGQVQQRGGADRAEKSFKKADTDGSGGVDTAELQQLLANRPGASSSDGSSKADFSSFDSDGNGSLTTEELDAGLKSLQPPASSTVEFAQQRGQGPDGPRGGPPPGPPPADGAQDASGSITSTTYDPLDTNQDGAVSAQERAAGELQNVVQNLVKATDGNDDGSLEASEVDALKQAVAGALQGASPPQGGSGAASSATSSAKAAGHDASVLQQQTQKLAEWVVQQYAASSASAAQRAQLSVSA